MKYENLWELWEPVFTEARPLPASDSACNKQQAGLISEYFHPQVLLQSLPLNLFMVGDFPGPVTTQYMIHSFQLQEYQIW